MRKWKTWQYTWTGRDIVENMKAYPKVNFRYFIHRSAGCNIDDLDFEGADTWPCQMIGRKDGANVINQGEGFYFRKMQEYTDSVELQTQYKTLGDYMDFLFQKENNQEIL